MVLLKINLYDLSFMKSACGIVAYEPKDLLTLKYLEQYCQSWAPGDYTFDAWENPADTTWASGLVVCTTWPDDDHAVAWTLVNS
jgi:hypothetical protein